MHKRYDGARTQGKNSVKLVYKHPTKRNTGYNTSNNDLQNTTQKAKNWATRTPLKTGDELRWFGRVNSSSSISVTRRVTNFTRSLNHELDCDYDK